MKKTKYIQYFTHPITNNQTDIDRTMQEVKEKYGDGTLENNRPKQSIAVIVTIQTNETNETITYKLIDKEETNKIEKENKNEPK